MYRFTATALFCLALTGCAALLPKSVTSNVDGLAAPDADDKKAYIILPGQEGVGVGDLQFKEFASYIETVLERKGFKKTASFDTAQIVVFLSYSVGDPQTHNYSYNVPIWGQTGVASSTTYGTVSSFGNSASYSGVTTNRPTYGVTGYRTQVATETSFTRFVRLEAFDVEDYRAEKKMTQVWTTRAVSVGASNDLRLVFPYMVVSMWPYIGTNTGKMVEVSIEFEDSSVEDLRGRR